MAFDFSRKWHLAPLVWIMLTVLLALGAGWAFALGKIWWVPLLLCSFLCAFMIFRNIRLISNKMRYLMEATLNNDFSYKFPTTDLNKDDREINGILNSIVEHLENITREARQNEAFLARVINLTDVGLALADAKGDIRLHNEAALRLLNRKALTNICQIPNQAYADLDIKRGNVSVNEKSFTLLTITDMSRQMQAIEVESWEKLTRVLTHEIMNSLTPIQSIAENMKGQASSTEINEAFDTISSSSHSLMQFVRNFREFSMLPAPQMRALHLKPILESNVRMAEIYKGGKQINISLKCFPPGLMIYSDEALLGRVLINILKNAIEANPRNISIEATEKADESVEISISNDGELIAEETAKHIFTPFFTTRPSGNGIGLSLSRRIIAHLGGTLSLKIRPTTDFSIRL